MTNIEKLPGTHSGYSLETDTSLVAMMQRAVKEVFDGNNNEFERAYAEAMAQQIIELNEVSDGFNLSLAEELADAMRGVLHQWLGEHSCCPREDIDVFLARIIGHST